MPYFRIMSEFPANQHNLTALTAVAVCTVPCSPSSGRLSTRKPDTDPSTHTHFLTMAARHGCSVQLLDTGTSTPSSSSPAMPSLFVTTFSMELRRR